MNDIKTKAKRKPVGRPRADGKPHLTRERVFEVCLKLIAENGYAGTGIRAMAQALNCSPASLFNLFGTKEGILNELIAFTAQPSLDFYLELNQIEADVCTRLYKSIFEEVIAVASANQEHAAIFYLPELRQPNMRTAQQVREQMITHYYGLVQAGIQAGTLHSPNAHFSAEQVFQLTETSIIGGSVIQHLPPHKQAKQTADFCLTGLLIDQSQLEVISRAAEKIKLSIQSATL